MCQKRWSDASQHYHGPVYFKWEVSELAKYGPYGSQTTPDFPLRIGLFSMSIGFKPRCFFFPACPIK